MDPCRLRASASGEIPCDSPQQSLQRLLAVPGSEPYRVNDLLLLRPEADGSLGESDTEERRCNRHVVFFHGDIQVSLSGTGVEDGRGVSSRYSSRFVDH